MIDLTPLDVRKKRGDFAKTLRGFDPQEVDTFLELVAERMEVLVKENLAFRGEIDRLGEKVVVQEGREQAVQDALVTAQELRQDVEKQARREAKMLEREARGRIKGMIAESEKLLTEHSAALHELERQRDRFLKSFRALLERELDTVEVEIGRAPLEDVTVDLDLGKGSWSIEPDEDDDGADEDDNNVAGPGAAIGADAADADAADEDAADEDAADEDAADEASADEDAADEDRGEGTDEPDAPAPDAPAAAGGETPKGQDQASKGHEVDDSLWLSSIVKDVDDDIKDVNAE